MTKHNLHIRVATSKDLLSIKPLLLDPLSFSKTETNDILLLSKIEANNITIAEINNVIIGVGVIDKIFPEALPLLSWGFVKEEYRNLHIWKGIKSFIKNNLKNENYTVLLHSAHPNRSQIIKSFESQGFIKAGEIIYPDNTTEHFYWEKIT
jgi:hypothetical protein